ncbi:hypothetical protein CGCFRS4_v007547 [Colletotrichum fructicola]|nr:hypothetical protein CGCFRS4_v007547 [Colletotrichum fructicola]KAF4939450.1 hypothetical protein CGCF245_v003699 [Colletotrichum fructicola]
MLSTYSSAVMSRRGNKSPEASYPSTHDVAIEAVQSFHVARSSSQLVKDGRPYCSDGTSTGGAFPRTGLRARGGGLAAAFGLAALKARCKSTEFARQTACRAERQKESQV